MVIYESYNENKCGITQKYSIATNALVKLIVMGIAILTLSN
jgi:hypothetical protein